MGELLKAVERAELRLERIAERDECGAGTGRAGRRLPSDGEPESGADPGAADSLGRDEDDRCAVHAEEARDDGWREAAGTAERAGERHSRQVRFPPIGEAGQAMLASAGVFVAGAGALGASLAQHMVRAGVGLVRIADRDYVDYSNLQRQALFDEEDARRMLPKSAAAAEKLRRIDSRVSVDARLVEIGPANADELLEGMDLVLDGLDNAGTRLLLEAAARRRGIPYLYGGASGAGGMTAVLGAGSPVCLGCIIGHGAGDDGATCEDGGILAPAVEAIAALQAAEALKWLTGNREAMRRGWLTLELWPFQVREAALPAGDPGCPVCGTGAAVTSQTRAGTCGDGREWPSVRLCGRDTVQVATGLAIGLETAAAALASEGLAVAMNPYLLRAELPEGHGLVLFSDGRALVQGTADAAEAERLCRSYIGRILKREGVEAGEAAV